MLAYCYECFGFLLIQDYYNSITLNQNLIFFVKCNKLNYKYLILKKEKKMKIGSGSQQNVGKSGEPEEIQLQDLSKSKGKKLEKATGSFTGEVKSRKIESFKAGEVKGGLQLPKDLPAPGKFNGIIDFMDQWADDFGRKTDRKESQKKESPDFLDREMERFKKEENESDRARWEKKAQKRNSRPSTFEASGRRQFSPETERPQKRADAEALPSFDFLKELLREVSRHQ